MSSRIEQFRKIVEQEPNSDIAHYGLGKALFDEKRYEEAESSFRRVIEIKPEYTAVYVLLGKALEKLSRQEEARQVYKKGIDVSEKTGDLMPKNEMEHRLMKLDWKQPSPE
jgi:Flp pilus assembly protein TadD